MGRSAVWAVAVAAALLLSAMPLALVAATRELVVDVGGHPDDFLALAALVKLDTALNVRVRAVTVHGNYAATLSAAVTNVREFLALIGGDDIPVVPGAAVSWVDLPERRRANVSSPGTTTSATITRRTTASLPTCARDFRAPFAVMPSEIAFEGGATGSSPSSPTGAASTYGVGTYTRYALDTVFGAAAALPATTTPTVTATETATSQVLKLLLTTNLEYVALGSLTNLAELLLAVPAASLPRLRVLHVMGGSVLARGDLSRWIRAENVASSGLFTRTTVKSSTATWNFFVDPVAADFVLGYRLPLSCTRFVYPRDGTAGVGARYYSGVGPYTGEYGGLTTGAMRVAAALRRDGARNSVLQASMVEFLAAATETHHLFIEGANAAGGDFDGSFFNPGSAFVALLAVHPTVTSVALRRAQRLRVGFDGVLVASPTESVPTADESFVYDTAVSARGVDTFWDTLFGVLGLTRGA